MACIILPITTISQMAAQIPTPSPGFAEGHTPVLVAIVDKVKAKDADVILVRRASMDPHDVILMSEHRVQADLIAEALWTLKVVRSTDGIKPTRDATYRIMMRPDSPERKEFKDAAKDFARALKDDPPLRPVEGFGQLRYLTAYLPDKKENIKIITRPKPD